MNFLYLVWFLIFSLGLIPQAMAQEGKTAPGFAYPHFQVTTRSEEDIRKDQAPPPERPDNNVTAMPPAAREQFDRNEKENRRRLDRNRDRHDHDRDRRHDVKRVITPGGFVPQPIRDTHRDKVISRHLRNEFPRSHRVYHRRHHHPYYRYNYYRRIYVYDPVTVVDYTPADQAVILPEGYDSISYGGVVYYYNDGQFYVPSNGKLIEVHPPVGAVIMRIPEEYVIVQDGEETYYVYAGIFYQRNGSGYEVIVPPFGPGPSEGVLIAHSDRRDIFVRLPDDQGGYVEVVLSRTSDGFKGPQGEYYPEFPSTDQLQEMYGNEE